MYINDKLVSSHTHMCCSYKTETIPLSAFNQGSWNKFYYFAADG